MKLESYISLRLLKKLALITISVILVAFIYVTVGLIIIHKKYRIPFSYENSGTDLIFRSSDGFWSDEENLLRGKDFRTVLISFELYKIQCGKSNIILQRTKPKKRPWNAAWWFDNYNSPKWKVPYVSMKAAYTNNNQQCLHQKPTSNEWTLAQKRADLYISSIALRAQ